MTAASSCVVCLGKSGLLVDTQSLSKFIAPEAPKEG